MIQGFLHFIWIGGKASYGMWMGIRKWTAACLSHPIAPAERVQPILWIDRNAIHAMTGDKQYHFAPSTLKYHCPLTQRLFEIQVCGLMRARLNERIPIALFETNRPLFTDILMVGERREEVNEVCTHFFNAVEIESNASLGGLPVLASDMLRLMILRCFGGMYVDATGLEPLMTMITIPNIEADIMSQAFKNTGEKTRTGIVLPPEHENYAFIVDICEPEVRTFLKTILLRYVRYFYQNPRKGIEDRAAQLAKVVKPSQASSVNKTDELNLYLSTQKELQEIRSKTSIMDVVNVHGLKGRKGPDPLLVQKFKEYQLDKISGYSINLAGFSAIGDILEETYLKTKGISLLSLFNLSKKFFGTTPLKGGKQFSYDQPLIGRARDQWEIARLIGQTRAPHLK